MQSLSGSCLTPLLLAAASKISTQLSNILRLTCELRFRLDFGFDKEITESLMTAKEALGQFEGAGDIF